MTPAAEKRFSALVAELENAARVPLMRESIQHGRVTTWAHCVRVAHCALALSQALHLHVSERELVRSALLHDYFLYDWHEPGHTAHATQHPVFALSNALEDFELTPLEQNAIAAHMWPLPPGRVPASREAWLICAADKWCSLGETLFMR